MWGWNTSTQVILFRYNTKEQQLCVLKHNVILIPGGSTRACSYSSSLYCSSRGSCRCRSKCTDECGRQRRHVPNGEVRQRQDYTESFTYLRTSAENILKALRLRSFNDITTPDYRIITPGDWSFLIFTRQGCNVGYNTGDDEGKVVVLVTVPSVHACNELIDCFL